MTVTALVVPWANDGMLAVAFLTPRFAMVFRPDPVSWKLTRVVLPDRVTVQLGGVMSPLETWMGAVFPVGATVKFPASAVALLKYVPGVDDTLALKCSETVPDVDPTAAGTLNGPFHCRF